MHKFIFLIFLLFVGFNIHAQTFKIEVEISNIINPSGAIIIAIFNNEDSFKNEKNPFIKKMIPVNKKNKIEIKFELPKGQYVIAVFQDFNKNNKIDYNYLGIPKEPFGFSNNPSCYMFPSYKDLQIHIKNNQKIPIKLKDLIN